MTHFEIYEFNSARLNRGESHCFRARMFVNGEFDGIVWLSKKDINAIKKYKNCTVGGFEKYEKKEKTEVTLDEKNINLAKSNEDHKMITNEIAQIVAVSLSQLSLIFFKHITVRTVVAKQIVKSMFFTFAIQASWLISSAIGIKAYLDGNYVVVAAYLIGGVVGTWLNFKIKV